MRSDHEPPLLSPYTTISVGYRYVPVTLIGSGAGEHHEEKLNRVTKHIKSTLDLTRRSPGHIYDYAGIA